MVNKSDAEKKSDRSLGQHMLHGSFWMILLRWAIRLTGLVSTVILARLLVPADFGIVAMAMFVVGLLELLAQSGQKLAIIRHHAPGREEYDTAWTVSVLSYSVISVLIFISAPFAVLYFHEPRVAPVLRLLALRSFLAGFENIGIVDFRRDLKFNIFFLYTFSLKAISFVVTVSLAFVLRNYWALVAGILSSGILSIVLSYAVHPYRPRFSLARIGDIWSFSTWTLLQSIGEYFNAQADQVVVGGLSGSSAMGRYAVASDVAASPTNEITGPIVAALYPVMSRTRSDPIALRNLYLRTFGWAATICFSAAVGTTMVAHDLISLILGNRWLDIEPLMGWLALAAGLLGLSSGAYTAFDALGKAYLAARMQWTRVIILLIVLVPVGLILRSLPAIAVARFVVTALFIPTLLFSVGREVGVSVLDYAKEMWRPAVSAGLMSLLIYLVNHWLIPGNLRLTGDVLLGLLVFPCSLLLLWSFVGKPSGPESDLWNMLLNLYTKYRNRALCSDNV
ncbi:MAG TPA: lipopolysaccharide biosynthesis protein [Rhizomicrobium sp.]